MTCSPLHLRTQAWYERQERVGYAETSSMLTDWKKQEELDFLNGVSCVPLQQGLRHLQTAFTNFFAGRTKYPNFKKKHREQVKAEEQINYLTKASIGYGIEKRVGKRQK